MAIEEYGFDRGFDRGIKQGIEQGEKKKQAEIIKSMHKKAYPSKIYLTL